MRPAPDPMPTSTAPALPRAPRSAWPVVLVVALASAGCGGASEPDGSSPSTTTGATTTPAATDPRSTDDAAPDVAPPATARGSDTDPPDLEVLDSGASPDPAERWVPLLADEGTCPGQRRTDSSADELARAATCLVNHARRERGLRALARDDQLDDSARAKLRLLVRCDEFTHTPCDRRLQRTFRDAGYGVGCRRWRVGENLAVGEAARGGSAREIVLGWLRSSSHRANMLDPSWQQQGMAVLKLARWEPVVGDARRGYDDAIVWADQFGTRTGC